MTTPPRYHPDLAKLVDIAHAFRLGVPQPHYEGIEHLADRIQLLLASQPNRRRVVQISVAECESYSATVAVVCNDGTCLTIRRGETEWDQLPPIPQDGGG